MSKKAPSTTQRFVAWTILLAIPIGVSFALAFALGQSFGEAMPFYQRFSMSLGALLALGVAVAGYFVGRQKISQFRARPFKLQVVSSTVKKPKAVAWPNSYKPEGGLKAHGKVDDFSFSLFEMRVLKHTSNRFPFPAGTRRGFWWTIPGANFPSTRIEPRKSLRHRQRASRCYPF